MLDLTIAIKPHEVYDRLMNNTEINLTVTDAQKARTTAEWSQIAGEPIRIECTSSDQPIYAFGSELAVLRIYRKMQGHGRANYSDNLNSWYYCNR